MPLFKRRKRTRLSAVQPRPRVATGGRTAPSASRPSLSVLKRMRRHGLVAACLNVIKGPLVAAEWDVEAADDGLAEELKELLRPLWRRLLQQALTSLDFGFAALEVVFDSADKRLLPVETRALEPAACEALTDETGRVNGLCWRGADGAVELESPRALWLIHGGEFGDPYGESHLTPAWPFWKALTYAVLYGNRWLERRALPPVVVRYPAELEIDAAGNPVPANESRALELAKRLNSEHPAVALPQPDDAGRPGWEIERLEAGGEIGPLIEWCDYLTRMLTASLFVPEKALYQAGERGSQALAREQLNTFLLTIDGLGRELTEQISAGLLQPLAALNGYPEARPRLTLATLAGSRRELYRDLVLELIRAGRVNPAVDQLAEELGVPLSQGAADDDDEGPA
ncbi:MAG: hypothetical protein GF399_11965 [Candidatus Coatesbacteria bacterium]|nr:hypothetical protein [Candidatus Coatesbacteria bacterium]